MTSTETIKLTPAQKNALAYFWTLTLPTKEERTQARKELKVKHPQQRVKAALAEKGLLYSDGFFSGGPVYRLTEAGRVLAPKTTKES